MKIENRNSGHRNSGNSNSGNSNSGDWNSGDWNSGDCNSGDWNSGCRNSGDCNSGARNSGDSNSGDRNSGVRNSGDWNSGDRNSGFLNTNTPKIRIFNKESCVINIKFPSYFYFKLNIWVSVNDMSEEEKEDHSDYKITDGYLKIFEYKEAWKKSFENNCDKEQAEQTVNLPNFDYAIFKEITGITKYMLDDKRDICTDRIQDYKDIKLEDLSQASLIKIIKKLSD